MSDWLCIIRPPRPTFIARADPSVQAGVQTPELHPFRTSLLAGRD